MNAKDTTFVLQPRVERCAWKRRLHRNLQVVEAARLDEFSDFIERLRARSIESKNGGDSRELHLPFAIASH